MLNLPERLTSVTHPYISSIYLKKNCGRKACEDVLVIETNLSHETDDDDAFAAHLNELLLDLEALKIQAERKIGHFDRVDIRTC